MFPICKRGGRKIFWTTGNSSAAPAERANAAITRADLNLMQIVISSMFLHWNSLSHLFPVEFAIDARLLLDGDVWGTCFA